MIRDALASSLVAELAGQLQRQVELCEHIDILISSSLERGAVLRLRPTVLAMLEHTHRHAHEQMQACLGGGPLDYELLASRIRALSVVTELALDELYADQGGGAS